MAYAMLMEKKSINNTDTVQTSVEKLQNNGANEISPLDFPTQSDHSYSMAAEAEISSESFDTSENIFCAFDSESFKKFISVVLPAEPNEIDRARIVKKINKYCQLADPNYLRSAEFSELLDEGTEKIIKNPVYLYFVLKDVKDCLLANKAEFRSLKSTEDEILSSSENALDNPPQGSSTEVMEEDNFKDEDKEGKKHKIVDKLTSLLKKVDEKIKELEELEVDFSDDEDSSYLKMQRYRERFCQVYEKLCNYTNKPLNGNRVGGVRKINFSDTDNLELNRAIEKWLNKTQQFPDYSDVHNLMIELNQSLNLKLTKEQLKIKAQQIFEKIGNMLQRRRHYDLWDSLSSFLNTEADPAVKNPELESALKKSYDLGVQKEKELLKQFAERQEKEQLQAREVPDEEANCSPEESGDEDEEEIETAENMLNSKISTDDDESSDGSDESENDESDQSSFHFPDSKTRNECPSKMVVKVKTQLEKNDPQSVSVSNDNSEHIDDVNNKDIDSHKCVNSENTETVGTNIGTIPVQYENAVGAVPNKLGSEDNLVVCKSENFMKRKNENLNENDSDNINIHPCKKFLEGKEMTETRNLEESEIINKSGSDSDCEIIEIVSNKEGESEVEGALSLNRKVYQVNYAFTNNNFNYNTVLSNNVLKKRHCFPSNYKNTKNQKSVHDSPPNELTDIKSIANKNALPMENKVKRKSKNIPNKPKSLNSITLQASKDSDLKNNDFAISTDRNNVNCSLHQEKSGEDMKSQKEVNKTNQNNDLQQDSSNETAAPPNGGSSSGGNGQDNSENNDNKKPSDRETQTEDNPENEDKEEDEEEDADTPEKPPETPKVTEAAPKPNVSRTNQKGQKVSSAAVFKPPPTEKVAPARRNSFGKQWEKPPGSETTQKKEPSNSTPTARSPRARPAPVRKRKVNQNGGTQGTPRQGKSNVFTFQFQKGPAELKKPNVNKTIPANKAIPMNKAVPTASSSRNNDVEIVQVAKKKRSTPVKPVQSDEEIVKNFLERSHPSISITTPKKKAVQKEPPPSVREALETLSRLKGISTTIVKGSSKHNTDDEVTIIGEKLNTRVNKISKQEKTPASSATATMPPPVAMSSPVAMPPPVATVTTSLEPLLPKIVTVQGNVPGFEDIVDGGTVIQDNLHQNYVQNPQASLVNVSGIKTNYSEHFYNSQAHVANFSATTGNYNEHFYSQVPVATVPGSAITFQENLYGPQAPAASISGSANTFQENLYGPQAPAVSISGSASTFQENLYGPQAPAASISGSSSTYEENFTGKVECIPIPRFRNVRSRSRRTPKKNKNIEYVILD